MQPAAEQLAQVAYFRDLSQEDLRWLAGTTAVRRFAARALVIREGEPGAGLYALLDGRARIFKTSRGGRQQVLAVLQPRDTFNEVPVFDGEPNPASVETLEASHVLFVPREAALALIGRSPHAALTLLGAFARRLREFARLVEMLAFDDVNRRVARFIAQLARDEGRPDDDGVAVRRTMTVQDIAAMVGSVREVVTRALSYLEHEGLLLVRSGEIVVPDPNALQRFSDE
jgi:CRP/FNR family transcriptional regulator